ncbi:hypothetical protein P389DRAFT_208320 [Cystobasidium minutum MCA 4210]|uniref:mitochondrial 37S ribosomal protein bS21m n=1 Tax=Cystobasidium minutum MCA 4210 TaxID=1397322 RepID=UPI0034CF6FA2|eukprot:jgi/Rhomi1/208320/estExt_Genemark1.C_1_t30366
MSFASKSSTMLRCACRADKQIKTSLQLSSLSSMLLKASLSTSAPVAAPASSSPSSASTSSSFSTSSSQNAGRVKFTPPENYPGRTSQSAESPIYSKIKGNSSNAQSSSNSKLFRGSGSSSGASNLIHPERKQAKAQGKEHKESQQEFETSSTIPEVTNVRPPVEPSHSRTLTISGGDDFARQYRRLMNGVIGLNNIRDELRRQERYEKPKYKRQRLRSARHRRRFANEVGLRVAAVLRAKSQGM